MSEDRHSGTPGGNGSGADVKSGTVSAVSDDTSGTVTFGTAFTSTPRITLTLDATGAFGDDSVFVLQGSASTTGFDWRTFKGHGGSGHTYDIHWIATDAGDP